MCRFRAIVEKATVSATVAQVAGQFSSLTTTQVTLTQQLSKYKHKLAVLNQIK